MTVLTTQNLWIIFGFFAQFIFFLRFVTQWIASERKGESVVPLTFWYLSIAGTVLITIYSIHQKDIVFTVASLLSFVIYFRNLALIARDNKPKEAILGQEEVRHEETSR